MAWTTPATWSDGSIVTAADLNAQVRDNLKYLREDAATLNGAKTFSGKLTFATSTTFATGGTSFPVSPSTNDLFYRTDLGLLCFYDGARWLTTSEYSVVFPLQTFASTTNAIAAPFRGGYPVYITRVATEYYVPTTNNAGNRWTILYRGVNQSYASTNTIHGIYSDAPGAGVYALDDSAPNGTVALAYYAFVDYTFTKTGSPGNLSIAFTMTYRLIVA